jgi:hypothetical protein
LRRSSCAASFTARLNWQMINNSSGATPVASTFGKIQSAADPRIVQLSLRVRF